ncbi:hypothetical protein J0A67_15290 [Algoriphagus aestuariicola]|uniref:Sensor histidine kinase n=1 Tax=Algoriphagus aestuariicola TaxID=1852016 RepID=A0ABS3BT30_9BACT|nr:hypothetical protein [Algoriphagus aestuariicola]MBN7802237.1 hypothetical protein [Algoriphagus aestuariicola]
MKLKTFRIWLFLLPLVAVIGVMLFVQSTNNQKELEQQRIRIITSLSRDVQSALSDYVARSEAYILRKGFAEEDGSLGEAAGDVNEFQKGFAPELIQLRYHQKESLPEETLFLDKGKVKVRFKRIQFPSEIKERFYEAVESADWI